MCWISHVFWICLNIHEYVQLCLNIECSVYNMRENGWSRMSLNMPRFSTWLNNTKCGWTSLEYAWILITLKVLLSCSRSDIASIKKRLIQNCIIRPRLSFFENTNMILYGIMNTPWSLNMFFEHAKDTEVSEFAWVCSCIMLEYGWTCLKQNLKSTYRNIGVFRILPNMWNVLRKSVQQK